MNLNKTITAIFFLLAPMLFFGQRDGEKAIRFKVVADSMAVSGVNVVNLVNEKSAMTDGNGEFTMLATAGDVLFLQSQDVEVKRKLVEPEDLKSAIVIIQMVRKVTELDEVIVRRTDKQDDLIMRHKDHRDFTPAERKLYTASTGPVDIIANALSGRTAMLRKELQVEMKERLLARLEIQFPDDYYTETLKIQQEYIGDFQRYLIDDTAFVNALKAKNKTLMRFLMGKLALNYHELMKTK